MLAVAKAGNFGEIIMRLNCPNCGAQYEVPDEVIPETGRDVQCSNCGNTWFQKHPDQDMEMAADLGNPLPDEEWTPQEPEGHSIASDDGGDEEFDETFDEDEAQTPPSFEPTDTAEPEAVEPEQEAAPAPPAEPARRRELDPGIADVLRQEADHEARVRAEEANIGLESQPDLGLDEPEDGTAKRAREARARMARMRGLPEDPAPVAIPTHNAQGSRREQLPDIEEINSTLRSTGDRPPEESGATAGEQRQQRRGGFRFGLAMVLILAAVFVGIYAYSDMISEAVPQLKPLVDGLVAAMNKARLWLDQQMTQLMLWLDSKASGTPASN